MVSGNPRGTNAGSEGILREDEFLLVHTLSPNDPALNALVDLPIQVPFHSIIGQHHAGAIETSSDGVVRSRARISMPPRREFVVRSGHNVSENRDAQREVIRILRLELQREKPGARC